MDDDYENTKRISASERSRMPASISGTQESHELDTDVRNVPTVPTVTIPAWFKAQQSLDSSLKKGSNILAKSGAESIVDKARGEMLIQHGFPIQNTDFIAEVGYFFDKIRVVATHDAEEKIATAVDELTGKVNGVVGKIDAAVKRGEEKLSGLGSDFEEASRVSTDIFVKDMRDSTAHIKRSLRKSQSAFTVSMNRMLGSAKELTAKRIEKTVGDSLEAFKQSIQIEAVIAARAAYDAESIRLGALITASETAREDIVEATRDFIEAVSKEREKVKKNWFEVLEDKVKDGNPLAITFLVLFVLAIAANISSVFRH
jgi:hypothetical protein